MSNIHGLGDYNSAPNRNQGNQGNPGMMSMGDLQIPEFMNVFFQRRSPNPRKDGFWLTMKNLFCYNLTWKSFITIISLVDIALFYLSVILSITSGGLNSSIFLGPNNKVLGYIDKDPYEIVYNY